MVARLYESGASSVAPSVPSPGSEGYPTSGDPVSGAKATKPGKYWFHMVTETLVKVVEGASLTPSASDFNQLLTAIKRVAVDVAHPVGTFIDTVSTSFNPNTVWPWTTWVEDTSGVVRVSKKATGIFSGDVNSVVGAESVELAPENIPPLAYSDWYHAETESGLTTNGATQIQPLAGVNGNVGSHSTDSDNTHAAYRTAQTDGGDSPVVVVQPSRIVKVWVRTA